MKVVTLIGIGIGTLFSFSLNSCGERNLNESFSDYSVQLLDRTLSYFRADSCSCSMKLFYETYPNSEEKVLYPVNGDTLKHQKVAYLWATSTIFSGLNAVVKTTGNSFYKEWLDRTMVPIVECYWDSVRIPKGYQTYPVAFGPDDRYYDDNTWMGLEYLNLYEWSGNKNYLEKAETIWTFLENGLDDVLGGGLYWCEQKKYTKNVCSNAPVAVFSLRLYQHTSQDKYLKAGKELYHWVKHTLRDEDGVYWDKIDLEGNIDEGKYAYNSGQMLQAASLLYSLTAEEFYLEDAKTLAKSCHDYFFNIVEENGETYRLLKNGNVWFAAVMLRGFEELYRMDGNPVYIHDYMHTLSRLWKEGRDSNGFFANNRLGESSRYEKEDKWLLTQGALVEMYARLSAYK